MWTDHTKLNVDGFIVMK